MINNFEPHRYLSLLFPAILTQIASGSNKRGEANHMTEGGANQSPVFDHVVEPPTNSGPRIWWYAVSLTFRWQGPIKTKEPYTHKHDFFMNYGLKQQLLLLVFSMFVFIEAQALLFFRI